jgi:tRNA U55 pseudouridine synthase TruB
VRDLAIRLAFPAHLSELYRISVGPFHLTENSIWRDLEKMPEVISVEKILPWPKVIVHNEQISNLRNGQKISLDSIHDGNFFLISSDQELLAWVVGTNGDYSFRRVFH